MFGDGLAAKLCEPCTEKWRILKNFVHCCWHHFLRRNCESQGLVYKEFVARYRLENHLRRVSTIRWSENEWTARVVDFVFSLRAINITTKIPLNTFRPVASKDNTTALDYSAFHNFKKLEPFINAGLGLVFQKMSKIYSRIVLERNGVQMFFFFLANNC